MPAVIDETDYGVLIQQEFDRLYHVAEQARGKGLDPTRAPECIPTRDVAERVEKSVALPGVANRIRELTKIMPREEVAFKVAEEIIHGSFESAGEAAAEKAIRTALSILDEGRTVASIQGISSVAIRANSDRSRYLAVYFAGPIRSAGGTEMGLILIVADFVRRLLGLDRYKATEEEIRRFIEELRLHEREVTRFQFKIPDKELMDVIRQLPIEVTGVQTDPIEVVSFRDLPRIETNNVRGGALRVVNDGLIGRAQKVVKIVDKVGVEGWSWLKNVHGMSSDEETSRELTFMSDVIGGRPIFSFPRRPGGFRLRYGRARNTGMAAVGVHPATMSILKNFIAAGTQLRMELPGKAGIVAPVESIEPSVVRLKDGSVVRIDSIEQAIRISKDVDAILFIGDLLVAFGEFLENNRTLVPSGFVEEWWSEVLSKRLEERPDETLRLSEKGVMKERITQLSSEPLNSPPSIEEALLISRHLGVPLHPAFTFFWEAINSEDLEYLREILACSESRKQSGNLHEIVLAHSKKTKDILERLVVPHEIREKSIVICGDTATAIHVSLGLDNIHSPIDTKADVFENLRSISGIDVRRKSGYFVGVRMGRPEKAKRREMKPLVQCLFPTGQAGGSRRNLVDAAKRSYVAVEIVRRKCPNCGNVVHEPTCKKCGIETSIEYSCPRCGRVLKEKKCSACGINGVAYDERSVDLNALLSSACAQLGIMTPPALVKGVKRLMSDGRVPERIEKGVLRAKYDLSVFKDGTVRFDATDAPLTHFKPSEVGVHLEALHKLGYVYDWKGRELVDDDQLCELRTQDIVISEACADYLVCVAAFIDELLQKLYGIDPYYRIKKREDLVGHLILGLSPHTSVGLVGRVVGFTKGQVCMAHPIWHAAKRRDCDGDEDAVILGLDALLNFSRSFLPGRIGGLMDAPLLLTIKMEPTEVARQAFNMEVLDHFPLEFFELANDGADPKSMTNLVRTIAQKLGDEQGLEGIGFTHHVGNLNVGNHNSVYKELKSMLEKIDLQLDLAGKIKAVDASEVARRVLATHLMRDVTGNLKAFSTQKFRCAGCNAKFRRIPLKGVCSKCGGKISLTVYKGTIEKYIEVATNLIRRYDLGKYHEQRLRLISQEIQTLFVDEDRKKQHVLAEFV